MRKIIFLFLFIPVAALGATVEKTLISSMNGKLVLKIEYDDVSLAITRVILVNDTVKAQALPTYRIWSPTITICKQSGTVPKKGGELKVPAGALSMIQITGPEGGVVFPCQIGLNVPFGADQ